MIMSAERDDADPLKFMGRVKDRETSSSLQQLPFLHHFSTGFYAKFGSCVVVALCRVEQGLVSENCR